jgi:hypothetical protein
MRRAFAILTVAGAALLGVQASAHHAITRMYQNTPVMLEGELAQVVFRNPHSIVHLVVKDGARDVRYAVEWAGALELQERGVTTETLKVGDFVVITGLPARNPEDRRLFLTALRRPKDNYSYQGSGVPSK